MEEYIAFIVFLICDISMILAGILFLSGHGAGLIAGYNTASEAERSRYDEKKLCRYMGYLMFSLAASWLIAALGLLLGQWLFRIGIGLFFIICIGGVIYLNVSGCCLKEKPEKRKKS